MWIRAKLPLYVGAHFPKFSKNAFNPNGKMIKISPPLPQKKKKKKKSKQIIRNFELWWQRVNPSS